MRAILIGLIASLILSIGAAAQDAALDVTDVVQAHASFSQDANKKTRKALDSALAAYTSEPTVETFNAHMARVKADASGSSFAKLRESAKAAADHLEPVSDVLPKQYTDLRYISAVALFNHRQKTDALIEMTHVEGLAYKLKDTEGEDSEVGEDLYYKSQAWGMAMEAYHESVGTRKMPKEEQLEEVLATYGADTKTINTKARSGEAVDEDTGEERLPFCKGGLNMKPKLRYPSRAARKGMVGAVIVSFSLDDAGAVLEPEILASVPDEGFKERAVNTIAKWTYGSEDHEKPGETCRLARRNLVLPMVFSLD